MPVIARFYGIVIKMYFSQSEHGVPHFHAIYGEFNAVFGMKRRSSRRRSQGSSYKYMTAVSNAAALVTQIFVSPALSSLGAMPSIVSVLIRVAHRLCGPVRKLSSSNPSFLMISYFPSRPVSG